MTPNTTAPTAPTNTPAGTLAAPTAAFALVNRPRPVAPKPDPSERTSGPAAAAAVAGGVLEPSYSIRELAVLLHVTPQTLYDLRYQGRGPTAFRVGRHLRFRHSEVTAWLEGLEAEDRDRHDHQDQARHDRGRDRQDGQGSGWR